MTEFQEGTPNSPHPVRPLFETRLSAAELESPELLEEDGITPEEAESILEKLGYSRDMWERVRLASSHEVKALIIIATGNQKRLEWVIRLNLRHEEGVGNPRWDEELLPPPSSEEE